MGISSGSESRSANKKCHVSDGPRLKREDHCLPPAQDNVFSPWKVLVGPNDWRNHSNGVEGAERYRLHNLPSSYFGPGVYELALYLEKCTHGNNRQRDALKSLKKDTIVVVYVGQAENVRTRLQHYGRCGSHLEGGIDLIKSVKSQHCETNSSTVLQANSVDFDRIGDDLSISGGCCYPRLFSQTFSQGYSILFRWTAAGSKADAAAIEMGLLSLFDYAWNRGSNGRRRPCDAFRKLQQQAHSTIKFSKSRSWYKPSKWRIRLPMIATRTAINLQEKRTVAAMFMDRMWKLNNLAKRVSVSDPKKEFSLPWKSQLNKEKNLAPWQVTTYKNGSEVQPSNTSACGILDANGTVCKNMPLQGRKRCGAHKGMRLLSASKPVKATMLKEHHLVSVHACKEGESQLLVCGYLLKDGSKCTVLPEKGRKRCLSHKGRRIKVK